MSIMNGLLSTGGPLPYFDFFVRETLRYSPKYAIETVIIHGEERLLTAVSKKGVIVAPVHYGSYFLIAGAFHHKLRLKASGIVTYNNVAIMPESERREWLDIYQRAICLQECEFFYAGKSSKNEIVDFLQGRDHALWSMLDVRESGRERPEFPFDFLGRKIYLQLGTARLARVAETPILPVCIKYDATLRQHHLHIGTEISPCLDEWTMTQLALQQIQEWIGDDMSQFFHEIDDFSRPSPENEKANGFGMLFDQFSRYKACEDLLSRAGVSAGDDMLDIGSGPETLFQNFLPGVKKTFIDPLIEEDKTGRRIKGDLDSPKLLGRTFSAVSAIDVLEHVPQQFRISFLERMSSFAEKYLILGFPVAEEGVSQGADELIDAEYAKVYGKKYPWLDEHYTYGLPSLQETITFFETRGWICQCIGHGHVPWLEQLLPLVITGWEIKELQEFLLDASCRFNTEFYPFDFAAPHYRYFVVCTRAPVAPLSVTAPDDFATADQRFRDFVQDLRNTYYCLSLRILSDASQKRDVTINAAQKTCNDAFAERDAAKAQLDTILQSKSWRVTRPMRRVARTLRGGVQQDDARLVVNLLHSWYQHLPVPTPVRRRLSRPLRRFVTRWLSHPVGLWVPPDTSIRVASPLPGKRDYIVFGVIDWHFRHQRPQQLALQLAARGNRVFYISVNFIDGNDPGFAVEPLDEAGRLFNLRLHLLGAPSVYESPPGVQESAQLRSSIGLLLGWAEACSLVALVQHPYWFSIATALPNSRLVYDCMDHHEGFGSVKQAMLAQERALLGACDLTVTTSSWLDSAVAGKTRCSVIVRNAADFNHFAAVPDDVYKDPEGRRVIGYYGAIAEWFDIELVAAVAAELSQCAVVLIGADTIDARHRLARYHNVTFLGEIAYRELPRYAHAFDVCLLPFKVVPLTLATNPVKVYEYLGMGKPVVSVDLPEVRQLGSLCRIASDHEAFVAAVRDSLQPSMRDEIQARREFARTQTWSHRADALVQATESTNNEPPVSVVIVTYNNLDLTKQCLASIDEYSDYPKLEVVVVDNASADGSPEWLREWAQQGPDRQLIVNDENLGFSAANNQGLREAKGEYLVMLNNDTHVTPGWVRTMVNHMRRDPILGLLGPVTNNIGNEARINIVYDNMTQMIIRASDYTRRHMGELFPLRTAAFFCVMLKRETFEMIGPLDEAFGRGFFEDDDYCRRVEQAGLRVVCAEDVFVHHHLSASFDKLKHQERRKLFEENKRIYEAKWGTWIPHNYREDGNKSG